MPGAEHHACARRFARNFRGVPWVRSPVIHWGCSSRRVLTMEYLPGIKISDVARLRAAGIDTDLVAQRATEAYLLQVPKRRLVWCSLRHLQQHQALELRLIWAMFPA